MRARCRESGMNLRPPLFDLSPPPNYNSLTAERSFNIEAVQQTT
jgi:hypothetical protein